MTLVVAWVGEDAVDVVADTLIDFALTESFIGARTGNPFGLPKIYPVNDRTMVGIAGQQLHLGVDEVERLRNSSPTAVGEVVNALETWVEQRIGTSFLVATTDNGGEVWEISHANSPSPAKSGWIGDRNAFDLFQRVQHSNPDQPDSLRMLMGLYAAIDSDEIRTVGGLATQATGSIGSRIGLVGTALVIEPEGGHVTATAQQLVVDLPDHDERMTVLTVPPKDETGGLGVYIPEISVGYFYPPVKPAEAWTKYVGVEPTHFVESVFRDFDIRLSEGFSDIDLGETLAMTVVDSNQNRMSVEEALQSEPIVDNAHPVLVANGIKLQLHRREHSRSRSVLADAREVLKITASQCGADHGDHSDDDHWHYEFALDLDRSVTDVAPVAGFLVALIDNPGQLLDSPVFSALRETMTPQRTALYGCLELARLSQLTGHSYRYELELCETDVNTIQMHRLLLEGNSLRAQVVEREHDSYAVELTGFSQLIHHLSQELPSLPIHFHTTGRIEAGRCVWACIGECTNAVLELPIV